MSYEDDLEDLEDEYEDGLIDEEEYEDAVEDLAAAEEEEAERDQEERALRKRRKRGGLGKHLADLTGASALPGGFPGGFTELPDPEWPDGLSPVADPDAWRTDPGLPWRFGPDGPIWPDK
jgi:hypothetical protein